MATMPTKFAKEIETVASAFQPPRPRKRKADALNGGLVGTGAGDLDETNDDELSNDDVGGVAALGGSVEGDGVADPWLMELKGLQEMEEAEVEREEVEVEEEGEEVEEEGEEVEGQRKIKTLPPLYRHYKRK